jgi:hypothetical protein
LCSGLACSVCVQCRCIQILMQLLRNHGTNNFNISLFPDTSTHDMITKHLPASPMKLKRICYKIFFARVVDAHLPTDQPILFSYSTAGNLIICYMSSKLFFHYIGLKGVHPTIWITCVIL